MDLTAINPNLVNSIVATFLFGSIYSSILLFIYSRKCAVKRETLLRKITQRGWTGGQVGVLLTGFIGLMILIPLLYSLLGGDGSPLWRLILTLLYCTSQLTMLILLGRIRKSTWARDFGMNARSAKWIPLSLAMYLALAPVLGIASLVCNRILEQLFGIEVDEQDVAQLIMQSKAWIRVGFILLAVIVAPLYEELIFRGVFFPYLIRRIGLYPALFVVSAAFAAIHFHLPSFAPLFLLSIALCLAYWRTGSLWTSIGLHALSNSVAILILCAST